LSDFIPTFIQELSNESKALNKTMIKNQLISTIRALSSSLHEDSISHDEAVLRINEIHAHFQQITEISGYDFSIQHMAAIPAAKGKALGLNYAAQCLLDYKRTIKFLKAVVSAIIEKQIEKPEKRIKIFYAGCGPYAPFITLVAPLFKSDEVQFSLLEINKNSVESAKKLIHSLQLTDYLTDFFTADAVTFNVPDAEAYDILISETLDAVLFRECYVPILFNLLPQFRNDIVLIPENVLLNVSFLPYALENYNDDEVDMGIVFDTRESVPIDDTTEDISAQFPDKKIDLTKLDMARFEKVVVDTKVHIRGDLWLYRNESSLTVPRIITLEQPFEKTTACFTYFIEPEIELKWRFE
jgi:hypothetical protein